MKIKYYPGYTDIENGTGPINGFFKDLRKERPPKFWLLVKSTIEEAETKENLISYEQSGWVERLSNLSEPIYEFKIPPKNKREGVIRLYFGYVKNFPEIIYILSAEKKHQRNKADPEKLKQAVQRYREVCL